MLDLQRKVTHALSHMIDLSVLTETKDEATAEHEGISEAPAAHSASLLEKGVKRLAVLSMSTARIRYGAVAKAKAEGLFHCLHASVEVSRGPSRAPLASHSRAQRRTR